jgi:hypothetical protein
MTKRVRPILEGILHSDDSTPTERLRAAELLEAHEDPAEDFRDFYADIIDMPEEALNAELDAVLICDAVRAVLSGETVNGLDPSDFPATAGVVNGEVARLLEEQRRRLEAEFAERLAQMAEAVRDEPGEDEASPEASEAPSEPGKAVGALVIDMYREADRRWDDAPPPYGLLSERSKRPRRGG